MSEFLSYYPLKQGLKHAEHNRIAKIFGQFLSYYPLKQGLKLFQPDVLGCSYWIFILLSIKTRIETKIKAKTGNQEIYFYPTIH